MRLSHSRAVLLMVLITLMWSTAGVVTRHLEGARSFEVTFWRSAFNALALVIALLALRGPRLWRDIACGGRALWFPNRGEEAARRAEERGTNIQVLTRVMGRLLLR